MARPGDFSKKTKLLVIKRATAADGIIRCEKCGGVAKNAEIDHVTPLALGGSSDLSNAELLCSVCHRDQKTPDDMGRIAKAKRQEWKARRPLRPPRKERGTAAKVMPRRSLYEDE